MLTVKFRVKDTEQYRNQRDAYINVVLVSLLLTLKIFDTFFYCFDRLLCTDKFLARLHLK